MLGPIGRAAMVPLWTAQLLTGAKSFERNGVIGSRRENVKATVFKAGSAIRADKFVIDQMTQSFEGYGGTVAVIKAPLRWAARSPSMD